MRGTGAEAQAVFRQPDPVGQPGPLCGSPLRYQRLDEVRVASVYGRSGVGGGRHGLLHPGGSAAAAPPTNASRKAAKQGLRGGQKTSRPRRQPRPARGPAPRPRPASQPRAQPRLAPAARNRIVFGQPRLQLACPAAAQPAPSRHTRHVEPQVNEPVTTKSCKGAGRLAWRGLGTIASVKVWDWEGWTGKRAGLCVRKEKQGKERGILLRKEAVFVSSSAVTLSMSFP
ncbi:unnamed protein product [Arctogadus glacialis]